jgi:uncharacterized OsmC-like protein
MMPGHEQSILWSGRKFPSGGSMTAPATIREYDISARSTPVFGRVMCSARNHHFIVDGPVQNGCPGEELTPPELFLSAIAACGVELVHVIARDEKKALEAVELQVHGVVDRANQPRQDVTTFTSVTLDFVLSGTDGQTAAALVEGFKRR